MAELVEEQAAQLVTVPGVVAVLSSILEQLADCNDSLRGGSLPPDHRASAFHGLAKPGISVRSYLERIFRYANCSPSCYVVAYIYLDRFLRRHPTVSLDSLNVHRFLITSVLAAVKFLDDFICAERFKPVLGFFRLPPLPLPTCQLVGVSSKEFLHHSDPISTRDPLIIFSV